MDNPEPLAKPKLELLAFRKERLQGLSCLKGNFHEQFLGGWAGAILPGYPALGKRALG